MFRLFRLWRLARHDLPLLWFALRHDKRPVWLIPGVAALAWLAVDPLNFLMPIVGVVDELVLLPLALHWLVSRLPAEILAAKAGPLPRP